MKYLYLGTYLIAFALLQWCILPVPELYAGNPDSHDISEMSSKKSEQLFIEIAIKLLNGKTRFVSLDNMVKILKDYNIVELQSKDIEPAEEIILKEVAFRMLKQHYLPRIGDKIKVYKYQQQFQRETGIRPGGGDSFETAIRLPLEIATVKDREQLKAIHWANLVMQISTVIEKLWLRRIGYAGYPSGNAADEKTLLEAAGLLRRKFIEGEDITDLLKEESDANRIVEITGQKIEGWQREGIIDKRDVPAVTELIIPYIIHTTPGKVSHISRELRDLRDIGSLKEALRHRIIITSENIKSYNPADYGVFAMLQSLLDEISASFSLFSNNDTTQPASIDFKESRHSA